MKHGVLKHWHPMAGLDYHIPWPPGSPSPAPSPAPYQTYCTMFGLLGPTKAFCQFTETVNTDSWGFTVLQGTDIGPMIPHIGVPSVTLPLEILLSSSKSHFVSARHQADGKPIAVSLLVTVNPNLNCGTPIPTPTGFVLALTTHRVDMSWGDVFGGLGAMLSDFLLQAALQKLGSSLGGRLSKFLQPRLYFRFLPKLMETTIDDAIREGADIGLAALWAQAVTAGRAEGAANVAAAVAEGVFGFFMGGPMGADAGTFGAPTPGGAAGDASSGLFEGAGRAFGEYLDGGGDSGASAPGDYPLADPNGPQSA